MDQASVSTEPGLEIGPVNCGKLLNCNEFMKYVVQIVNKERRSLKKNYYYYVSRITNMDRLEFIPKGYRMLSG